jgi:hypothetical protein
MVCLSVKSNNPCIATKSDSLAFVTLLMSCYFKVKLMT